LKGLNIIKIN
jgi:hypothetical protein